MSDTDFEQLILEFVNRPGYRPEKPRGIAKQLRLPPESKADVRRAVKQLIRKGKLQYGSNHLVHPANRRDPEDILGRFHRAAAGFGFVRPLGVRRSEGRAEDIFVPANRTLDAANGDTVSVRLGTRRRGGDRRVAGEITEVVQRRTHQFVGTYLEERGQGFVQVDGTVFARPVYVGDAGAKNAQAGDKVVLEMVRFPSAQRHGEGVLTEVLGAVGKPGLDTLLIIREFGLPDEFPDEAIAHARQQAEQFDESEFADRVDLTGETVITIDPEDARDFDDAISLTRLENGHWQLAVHIADVAHFVRKGTALDREAKDRGTSIYLPDRVIPMLPEIISNNLASLQPNRVRYAKTALMEFTPDGIRIGTEVVNSAIRSDRRFTYEEVDDYLANRAAWKERLTPDVFRLLGDMHKLAMIFRKRRRGQGAIELSMREIKLELDREGHVEGAHAVEYTESHQVIEEFMLAANFAVAEMLRDRQLYFLRRVHESPDPRKLKLLTEFVRHLKIPTESLESRFEIKRVLEFVHGTPEEYAVNYSVLRSLQKAVYGPEEEGHYALASDCYCHFTSPIRRYPDLTIHRLLDALARKQPPVQDFDQLSLLGEHCSQREQRAEMAERELIKLKLLNYFRTRIGEEMDVVVTGVESFGLFVQGLALPADGLIPVDALGDDFYDFDESTYALVGRRGNRFQLGDELRVTVAEVDMDRRELDFRFLHRIEPHTGPRSRKKPRGAGSRERATGKRPTKQKSDRPQQKKTTRSRRKKRRP